MLQIEQLQRWARITAGASTSNRTRPQWQPPVWVIGLGSFLVFSSKVMIHQ